MAEEIIVDDEGQDEINRTNSRIKTLSDKVKTTSEERDALKAKADEAEAKALAAQKDADFFKGFNTTSGKYPGSNEYQDKIREKVALGLDIDEATMLVMAKEGKYVPPVVEVERESAAGGSANTTMRGGDEKTPDKMTQAERRAALEELELKGEDLLKL